MIDSIPDDGGTAPDLKRSRRQKPAAVAPKLDRLPPHSPEAEQGVLGCVLLSPNQCMGECIEKLKGSDEFFYDLRSEEHTSELQSQFHLVCRLLLEKKKK